MTRLSLSVVGASLLVVGVGAFLLGRRHPARTPRDERPSAATDEEMNRLRRELSLTKIRAVQLAARETPQPAAAPAVVAADETKPTPLTPEQKRARTRAVLAAWYASIDAKLSAEPVDAGWSAEATRGFETMLARYSERATLQSTKCASTMCRIVLSHADKDAQRLFASEIAEESQIETQVAYKYDAEATPPTTTMWVSRAGHPLPKPQRGN